MQGGACKPLVLLATLTPSTTHVLQEGKAEVEEEVLAQEGVLHEVHAVQHDEWEAQALRPNLPPRPPLHPDTMRTVRGMPPVSPQASATYQLAEQARHALQVPRSLCA